MKVKNLSIRFLAITVCILMLTWALPDLSGQHNPEQPNIIIILSDDVGYSDLGCMGGEVSSPNLDAIAANGILFTHCYNNAKCAPTRASLMTGLYNQRTEAWHSAGHIDKHGALSMAELFRNNGYATIASGKWHIKPNPMEVGFDRHSGVTLSPTYFKPPNETSKMLIENKNVPIPDDFYSVVNYTDYAMQTITEESLNKQKPFFLYLAYHNTHWPLQAKSETIDKYRGIYDDGTAVLRENRYNRMVELGIIDLYNSPLSSYESKDKTWDQLTQEERDGLKERMPIHTAMFEEMDEQIGRLMDYLKANNLSENTVVFYLQDNGASGEGGLTGDTFKPGDYGIEEQGEAGTVLSFYRLGSHPAVAFNTPLRRYKSNLFEGGMRTPLIVHWPNGIKNKGTINQTFNHVSDLAPTCYDIAGVDYPSSFDNRELHPIDGRSFLDVLNGEKLPDRTYFWKYEKHRAVRSGDWKLFGNGDKTDRSVVTWELYNLAQDQTETNNLADEYPEKVEILASKWDAWADDVDINKEFHEKANDFYLTDNNGLELYMNNNGKINDLRIQGNYLYNGNPSGFYLADPKGDSEPEYFSGTIENNVFTGTSALNIDINASIRQMDNYIEIEGDIVHQGSNDKGVWLGFNIPLDTKGMVWSDNLTHPIAISDGELTTSNLIPIPTATGTDGGVGMAIPPTNPAIFKQTADGNGIRLEWAFGLSDQTPEPSAAHFKFRIFSTDHWGFRSALAKYYDWYDEYYSLSDEHMLRLNIPYIWYHSGEVEKKLEQVPLRKIDEGMTKFMAYLNPSGAIRNSNGTFTDINSDEDFWANVDRMTELKWHGKDNSPGELAMNREIVHNTVIRGINQRVYYIPDKVSSSEIALPFNFEFDIPEPNKGNYMFNMLKEITGQGNINAFHWDRVGAWGAYTNYRRDHYQYTHHPLTFDARGDVCMHLKMPMYEFFRGIRDYALQNDLAIELAGMKVYNMEKKDMDAGGLAYDGRFFTSALAWSGWHEGNFKLIDYGGYDSERIFLGRKTYRISSGNITAHNEEPVLEKIKIALSQCAAYGVVPAISPQYFYSREHPHYDPVYSKYYNPSHKALWDKYMPAIDSMRIARWEPVTGAFVEESNTLIERFGSRAPYYFSLWSPNPEDEVTVHINAEELGLENLNVDEIISDVDIKIEKSAEGWKLTVTMEKYMTRVLKVSGRRYPSPSNGEVNVPLWQKLIFLKDNSANKSNLYFGSDSVKVAIAGEDSASYLSSVSERVNIVDPADFGHELLFNHAYY